MLLRLRVLVVCAVACVAATLAIVLVPALQFAYHDDPLHVALETTVTLVALVAACLLIGRVSRTRFLDEALLACGLATLALSNLVFAAIPAISPVESHQVAAWGALVASCAAALLIAAASLLPRRPVPLTGRQGPIAVLGVSGALVAVTLALVDALGSRLPEAVRSSAPDQSSRPALVGHPALLTAQIVLALTYAVAAAGFYRRSRSTGDELSAWLAVGSVLASAARVNYFLYPSLYVGWVYSGDVFRLGFYLMLLVGAAREIGSYWASEIEAAHLEERRRIARDLHDGLAQEIAFIGRNAALLRDANGDAVELAERIGAAAERARAESRSMISALSARADEPLDRALADAAREAAARYGASLDLQVASEITLLPERCEALVRIAAEAIANAARHSGAPEVRVELSAVEGGKARLRVIDRGRGFDAAPSAEGFGLLSMRERAVMLGGRFQVHSRPGRGTQVEVLL
jgi:signal transduction histidine kinase